jgi:alanine transaminase
MSPSTNPPSSKVLSLTTINAHVLAAQYAVRGLIPQRAEQLRARISAGQGADLPFDDVIFANIGNPQQLDQPPLTFFRQVASLLEYPALLDHEKALKDLGYPADVVERARRLLKDVKSVGAYSNSAGAPGIKKSVADFIERKSFMFAFLGCPIGATACHAVGNVPRLHP